MRVGEQRSVQRMILVAETGRLASIATLGHMTRQTGNDEARPEMTRQASRAMVDILRYSNCLENFHGNLQPHKAPLSVI